jgi:hypothetical protein
VYSCVCIDGATYSSRAGETAVAAKELPALRWLEPAFVVCRPELVGEPLPEGV